MSDCRFGVSPVNYPDPDPEYSFILNRKLYFFFFFLPKKYFFSPKINNHSFSYVRQWLEHFITRVKLIFKDNGI